MVSSGRARFSGLSPTRTVSLLFGAVFLVVGVAGFIPGLTTNYGDLGFGGHGSGAELLDTVQVSVLHNAMHLLFGVAGILMARSDEGARTYLVGGGTVYLLLWVYGLVIEPDSGFNFVPVNTAGNWLHLGLALGMLGFGLLLPERSDTGARARR